MNIGIYAASSQSGRAYLADLTVQGHRVYGYCRSSNHGKLFLEALEEQKGIYLRRPSENKNHESANMYIPLERNQFGSSLEDLITHSELIILAEPSIYFLESVKQLKEAGLCEKRIPLLLSPSRTFTVPEIWSVLGENYPIICFSTCPYSCKAPEVGVSYIKRRKRSWIGSYEGTIEEVFLNKLQIVFPQCIWTDIPAITSLGNIGSVFHPGTYLLNLEAIQTAKKEGREYSFYMNGIAERTDVGEVLQAVDNIRLEIAKKIGIKTLAPGNEEDEAEWKKMTDRLHSDEEKVQGNITELRHVRRDDMYGIADVVVGAQFWLDYTYGVSWIKGETLSDTIARTPTYQKMSVPQERYIEEDVPTGLIPLYEIGKRLNVDVNVIEKLIEQYCKVKNVCYSDINYFRKYSTKYIVEYLTNGHGGRDF